MILELDDGRTLEPDARTATLILLLVAARERIAGVQTGRVVFHMSHRRVVLELAASAVAEALIPREK